MAMLSIGYAADIATLEGEVLAREIAARARRTLNELFFSDNWGKAVD